MSKARKLRGKTLPSDVWEFLDSNVPSLIINVLRGYIETVEKERDDLLKLNKAMMEEVRWLRGAYTELDRKVMRLANERIMEKPEPVEKEPPTWDRVPPKTLRKDYRKGRR